MTVQRRVIQPRALAVALVSMVATLSPMAKAGTLVGWYQFDDPSDPWRDSSGNQKNGTVVNDGIAPVYSSSNTIQGGGSAYFNGTFNQQNQNFQGGGGRINVPINTGPVAMPNMSWGAWVRAALVDRGRYVLSSDQYNGGRGIGVDNRAGDDFAAILGNSNPYFYDTGVAAPIFDSKDVILGSLSVTVGQSSLSPERVAFIVDRVSFGARIVSKAIARES